MPGVELWSFVFSLLGFVPPLILSALAMSLDFLFWNKTLIDIIEYWHCVTWFCFIGTRNSENAETLRLPEETLEFIHLKS